MHCWICGLIEEWRGTVQRTAEEMKERRTMALPRNNGNCWHYRHKYRHEEGGGGALGAI